MFMSIIDEALSSGGDFAEIFLEDRENNSINMVNDKLENAVSGRDQGAGIRVIDGLKSIYVYTNDTSKEGLAECAKKAAGAVGKVRIQQSSELVEVNVQNSHEVISAPSSVSNKKKVEVVRKAYARAKGYSGEIIQVSVGYVDSDQRIWIMNSEGYMAHDRRIRTRLYIQSVAGSGSENQTGFEGPGMSKGFEMFEEIDAEKHAEEASRTAVTMLNAKTCPAGRMPVVINNGFGGVIFHEACGHSLEATSVAKGNSVFSGKLGKKIASECVTAYDNGTIPNAWGSINIDDEGFKSCNNILIENGILKNFMIDRLNGKRMGMKPTGNSRRQSYRYAPTSRMTNTYIASGQSGREEIINSVNEGLYAKKMGGGSVNPATGEFNFAVAEGYLIRNGSIDKPVRGATLIGKGSDILMKIDMVGSEVKLGQGMCGSISGSVPTNVGQPILRVSEMTVGGR